MGTHWRYLSCNHEEIGISSQAPHNRCWEHEISSADDACKERFVTSGGEATDAEYVHILLAQMFRWFKTEIRRDQQVGNRLFRLMR